WLYRGQKERFVALVQKDLAAVGTECVAIPPALEKFESTLATVREKVDAFGVALQKTDKVDATAKGPIAESLAELREAETPYEKDREALLTDLAKFAKGIDAKPPATTKPQHTARKAFDPLAERIRGVIKQIDLLAKLADRAHGQIGTLLA